MFAMIIGGYKKAKRPLRSKYVSLKEVSVSCTVDEFLEFARFVNDAYTKTKSYSFPYGACTLQFRDWSKTWKAGDPDIVLVIEPSGRS